MVVRVAPPHCNWQPARPLLVVQLSKPAATRHGLIPDGQVGVSAAAWVPLHAGQRALRGADRRREEGPVCVLGEAVAVVVRAEPELKVWQKRLSAALLKKGVVLKDMRRHLVFTTEGSEG